MIKLFRKIRQNLLSEGKTGKYLKYAIGEIILVVIGILIALSINNWNENRKDRKEELVALKDLKKEFESNLEDVNKQLKYKSETADLWENYLNKVSNKELSNKERAIMRPRTGSRLFAISNSTLNSLLNTGKIDKIKNDSLKLILSNWNDVLEYARLDEVLQYEYVHKVFVLYEHKLLPNGTATKIYGAKNFFHTQEEIKKMRLEALNNIQYQNGLEHNYILLKSQVEKANDLAEQISNVIELLTDEISKR